MNVIPQTRNGSAPVVSKEALKLPAATQDTINETTNDPPGPGAATLGATCSFRLCQR